jgi:MFS family permease
MMNTKNAVSARFFSNKMIYPWIICLTGMLFYCYNYFIRVSPSVMQDDLIQSFHITAYQFGALAAFYYYAYTPMQVPAGMIFDKFGTRVVLLLSCLTAVLGLALFVSANNYASAAAGRFLIGLGTAFSYIGVLKLASIWLPPNRFATVAGLTTALGMTSGALSQKYLATAVAAFGYKQALHFAVITGVILSIVIFCIVRNQPKRDLTYAHQVKTPVNIKQLLGALRTIFMNRQMWLIGVIGCLLYLPASVFLDLWGIPYLKSVYQLTPSQAVDISSLTFFGWIIGGPIIGAFSDRIKRRRLPLIVTGTMAAILLCVVFYVPGMSLSGLQITFLLIGFCCGAHPLCFALGKENNPIQMSGTAVAITNMLIMAGGAIFQPLVGKLLDMHANGFLGENGLPAYNATDYTFALSVIPLGVATGIFLSFFLKETYCTSAQAEKAGESLVHAQPDALEVETEGAV